MPGRIRGLINFVLARVLSSALVLVVGVSLGRAAWAWMSGEPLDLRAYLLANAVSMLLIALPMLVLGRWLFSSWLRRTKDPGP